MRSRRWRDSNPSTQHLLHRPLIHSHAVSFTWASLSFAFKLHRGKHGPRGDGHANHSSLRGPSGQSISQAWQPEFCPQNSHGRRNDSHKLSSDPHTHAVVLYPLLSGEVNKASTRTRPLITHHTHNFPFTGEPKRSGIGNVRPRTKIPVSPSRTYSSSRPCHQTGAIKLHSGVRDMRGQQKNGRKTNRGLRRNDLR